MRGACRPCSSRTGSRKMARGAAQAVLAAAKLAGVHPVARARAELDELSKGGVHQGVIAVTGEYPYASVEQILIAAEKAARAGAGAGPRRHPGPAESGRAGPHRARGRRRRHHHPARSRGRHHPRGGEGLGRRHRARAHRARDQRRAHARGAEGRAPVDLRGGRPGGRAAVEDRHARAARAGARRRGQGHTPAGAARLRPLRAHPDDRQGRVAQRRRAGAMLLYETARQRA